MNRLLLFILLVTQMVSGAIYVSQTGAGSQNGTSAGNDYPVTFLTTSGNWGSGGGQVGPGVTVMLEGNITTAFSILGSGSTGNPITIQFDTGATMSAPTWGPTQAIVAQNKHDIVIDGGGTNNGAIYCTATGFGLAHGNPCNGIAIESCTNFTVQNIAVTNIYLAVQNQESDSSSGSCIYVSDGGGLGSQNILVSNVLTHDSSIGFGGAFGPTAKNWKFVNSESYNCNWCCQVSDLANGFLDGLTISNDYFHSQSIWNDPADNNHHNEVYVFTANGGTNTNTVICATHFGGGLGGSFQTSQCFIKGNVANALVINDIFDATDGSGAGTAQLFAQIAYETAHYTVGIFNDTFQGSGNNNTAVNVGDLSDDAFPAVHNPNYCISNCIFDGVFTAVAQFYSTNNTVSEDYDLVFGITSGATFAAGTGMSSSPQSLAAWQALGRETHIVQGNPLLNSSFQPQTGSAAIGAAATLAGFTADLSGAARTPPWTIGAYQVASATQAAINGGGSISVSGGGLIIVK
jgi:hypothetical protein